MAQFVTAAQAVSHIRDNDTLIVAGFGSYASPEELMQATSSRFQSVGHPKNLTVACGITPGDKTESAEPNKGFDLGLNRMKDPGLIGTVLVGNLTDARAIAYMAGRNEIAAYIPPMGVMCNLFRAVAGGRPGLITKVGLDTFADPRIEGCAVNEKAREQGSVVELMEIDGEEYLFYHSFKPDVCFLRATYADEDGNLSMVREGVQGSELEIAVGTHNNGGIVIAQVEQVLARGSLPVKDIRIHGQLVDYVVVASDPVHARQCYARDGWRPELCGLTRTPAGQTKVLPLTPRKVLARRAAMKLRPGLIINIGSGIPSGIGSVAAEEGLGGFTVSVESGPMGGEVQEGLSFPGVANAEAIYYQCDTIDMYDGGMLDVAFLGFAEIDRHGNVNVSKFAGRCIGAGGFIDISQNAKKVFFMGTFSNKADLELTDDGVKILKEGSGQKFVDEVQQITFSGKYAMEHGQEITYITERCVFKLTPEGLMITEIAKGVDLESDILAHMAFRPLVADEIGMMDERLFRAGKMGINLWEVNAMEQKYPHLCSPITIGKTVFRHRMFSAPMGGTEITWDGCIGERSLKFYELRAYGGAAAVTVSECMVHPTDGSHAFRLDLSVPGSLPSFTYTADAIKRHGAIPSVELSHSGQFAGTYLADRNKKQEMAQWGPSEGTRSDGTPVKALSVEQIHEIAEAYGNTAALAKRAGFEMLMVHGGHGWLINQFLSPLFNHRTDEYGGSFENRVRFAREVLTAVRKAVGPWFPIEFRMSGDEFVEGGYHLDEGVRIAQAVEDLVDIIHVSAGTYQKTFGITHPSWFEEHGRNVYLAAEIKKHVKKPVATLGGLSDPAMMEEIIASGKADIVEMARQLLADNQFPNKVMSNRDDEIVHCIRCFTCMAERASTFTRRCTCNPLIGRETEGFGELQPSPHPKKVLVVGGGPGGLYAAYTAARRGHAVTLCEASQKTGGLLIGEAAIPFKYDMYLLGETYRHLAEKAGVEIRLNTRVDRAYVEKEAPDAVIVAAGSEPLLPPIPGLRESPIMFPAEDYHLNKDKVGDTCIVLGGGLVGCEMAVCLARDGKNVHIVEMRSELCPDANVRYRPLLMAEMAKYSVNIHTDCTCRSVSGNVVTCETPTGETVEITGDSILCGLGLVPKTDVVEELRGSAPFFRSIGNCVKPDTITHTVYQGYHAALDI